MEKGTFKVVLADGTSAENLRQNGNNYISTTEITKDIFVGNLSTVTIEGPDGTKTHHDMKLVQLSKVGGEWWFILAEKAPAEKIQERLETAMTSNAEDITSVQLALAEIYEMIVNGGM